MSSETEQWMNEQLRAAGYDSGSSDRQSIGNSVRFLMRELDSQKHVSRETRQRAVELFYKLAMGHAIAPRGVQDVGARWVQYRLGSHGNGCTVRVKADAYTGSAGRQHNGMVGRAVAARGGEVVVQYADSAEGTGHRHNPTKLEVLTK